MSNRYKGGIISATPPTLVAGAGASGAWTLEQQMQATAAGLWPVNGPFYIEDMFQTWLYTGNGTTQTIINGIDLAGKGGMVWCKVRNTTSSNFLFDTARGANALFSNLTNGQQSEPQGITSFNANGFTLGTNGGTNGADNTYASWTFREQPKFFDVVTYTGNDTTRSIPHNLGAVPGCMIIKATNSAKDWYVYHRGMDATAPEDYYQVLNTTAARVLNGNLWDAPTSTHIVLNTAGGVNQSGVDYVAYLFAHDAGGFGPTGTDNVISCGSFTANTTVDLGYEPQWVMLKNTSGTGGWYMFDNMRGMPTPADAATLFANLSGAEGQQALIAPTSTGFTVSSLPAGNTFIYIAIRRGPMKVPTDGTSVFSPVAVTAATNALVTTNFPVDMVYGLVRAGGDHGISDRLRGISNTNTASPYLRTDNTAAESTQSFIYNADNQTGYRFGSYVSGAGMVMYSYRRAPGFFDEVCYTGTGVARTVTHNLTAVPELMIVKARATGSGGPYNWTVYHSALSAGGFAYLNLTNAGVFSGNTSFWNGTAPTASVFSLGGASGTNESGNTYVNYLFASAPGVSKVGSYTGTGTTQTINCGFTAGSRFVMIKRADNVGDWFVWDTARGMIPANDPYLLLNSTAAEVTGTDFVDTAATGFEITSTAPAAINANGGTFIYLAIA
jgi:hypothetical protein